MTDAGGTVSATRVARRDGFYRGRVFAVLERLTLGTLTIRDRTGVYAFGTATAAEPDVQVTVEDTAFYRHLALDGGLGAAESFMRGEFSCADPTALVRLFIRNRSVLDDLDGGLAIAKNALRNVLRFVDRNSRRGSRRNIAAHYDLGNDLFALFLDANMMYSAAVFPHPAASLEVAAAHKNDLICRKLDLRPGDHLLEIGSGWGGFAIQAARDYGSRVTTTTISREQFDLARQRVDAAGLADRVTVLLTDYRDLGGRYDKIVSIEMIEAVGHEYYDAYFGQCSALLRDDGLMCLQAITMNEQNYEQARRHVDFIKKYIFPGGCLPSVGAITASLARAGDLNVMHLAEIGSHYAETLRRWRQRFNGRLEKARALGYDAQFVRMWQYYLHYCEAAFAERVIGSVQILLHKPRNRRADLPDIAAIEHYAG